MKRIVLLGITTVMLLVQLKAQNSTGFTAFTVAHNNGTSNVLLSYNALANQWKAVGLTNTNNIKAIATDPVNRIVFAVNGNTFGKIDTKTGSFTAIGNIGQANGEFGIVALNNIEGLTFDFVNNKMYATHSIESGSVCSPVANSNDLLFQINIFTGKLIPNAMRDANGNASDYSVIELAQISSSLDNCTTDKTLYDVNGIAFDKFTGLLYAIQNQGSVGAITLINSVNGKLMGVMYELGDMDLVDLGFNSFGDLFGTTGSNSANKPANCFEFIDLQTNEVVNLSLPDSTGVNFDFKSLDFFTAYNDLALQLTVDPAINLPLNIGDAVTFNITIYNQGELDNTDIIINNYVPEGLLLNDLNWTLIPGTNNAEYTLNSQLAIGANISIPIHFTIANNVSVNEIVNFAEITASFNESDFDINGDLLPLPDIDSTPDAINNEFINGNPIVDNEINQEGPAVNQDEDDHDFALISINESLPLQAKVTPQSCNSLGVTEVKLSGNGMAPYFHNWEDQFGNVVHTGITNNLIQIVGGLQSGIYNVTVNDALDRTNSFEIIIPFLAENGGNINCSNTCPNYLSTPSSTFHGIFQAQQVVEINGFVSGLQDAEFRICE